MFFRLFSYTLDVEKSKKLLYKIISKFPFNEVTEHKCEKYWKIENMFVSQAQVKLTQTLHREDINIILKSICDKWSTIGYNPITTLIASSNCDGGCNFFDEKIDTIFIELDYCEEELFWDEEEIIQREEQERIKNKQPKKTGFLKL